MKPPCKCNELVVTALPELNRGLMRYNTVNVLLHIISTACAYVGSFFRPLDSCFNYYPPLDSTDTVLLHHSCIKHYHTVSISVNQRNPSLEITSVCKKQKLICHILFTNHSYIRSISRVFHQSSSDISQPSLTRLKTFRRILRQIGLFTKCCSTITIC